MKIGFLSFRLGCADGVSVSAESWARALRDLGAQTCMIAGYGPVDRHVPGLCSLSGQEPGRDELREVLSDIDLVVVENLMTLPLHLPAARAVGEALRGRAAILHHHDPPWHRRRYAHLTELPMDDPHWVHVAASRLTCTQLHHRGFRRVETIYTAFTAEQPDYSARSRVRDALGIGDDEPLFCHPVRAISRKNIPAAIDFTADHGGVYWLTGPAEEGYAETLSRLLRSARCRTVHRPLDEFGIDAAYAAADVVLFPSRWEGFGNPPIEAAVRRRPVVVGRYPVATELRSLGFDWPTLGCHQDWRRCLSDPRRRREIVTTNAGIARAHFSPQVIAPQLSRVISRALEGRPDGAGETRERPTVAWQAVPS